MSFTTDAITAATYANGVLDLTELAANGQTGVMPLHVSLPNPASWELVENSTRGLTGATLLPVPTISYPGEQGLTPPPGGAIIHIT